MDCPITSLQGIAGLSGHVMPCGLAPTSQCVAVSDRSGLLGGELVQYFGSTLSGWLM